MLLGWNSFLFFFNTLFPQGAALIRMLANFMGHSVFQRGLQVSKILPIFSYLFPLFIFILKIFHSLKYCQYKIAEFDGNL